MKRKTFQVWGWKFGDDPDDSEFIVAKAVDNHGDITHFINSQPSMSVQNHTDVYKAMHASIDGEPVLEIVKRKLAEGCIIPHLPIFAHEVVRLEPDAELYNSLPPPAKARKPRAIRHTIDISKINIDKDVSMDVVTPKSVWDPLLEKLEVGDSFLLPPTYSCSHLYERARKKDMKLKSKFVFENDEKFIRVWRIS